VRIEESQGNIVALSDIRAKKSLASSPYGPVRAGSIIWQGRETVKVEQLVQLSELLNSLESVVESLNFKSFEVYDTLMHALEGVRVALYDTVIAPGGTDE
jgi:hypothetical protein